MRWWWVSFIILVLLLFNWRWSWGFRKGRNKPCLPAGLVRRRRRLAQNSSNPSKYCVGRAFACPPEGGACLPDLSAGGGGRGRVKGILNNERGIRRNCLSAVRQVCRRQRRMTSVALINECFFSPGRTIAIFHYRRTFPSPYGRGAKTTRQWLKINSR
jgi:hypothetical protein